MKRNLYKVLWYVARPKYYLQFLSKIYRKIFFSKKDEVLALSWCAKRAITTNEALHKITNIIDYSPVKNKFPEVFEFALKKSDSCPVKMGGEANLDLLYYLSSYLKAKKIVETGVAYGWSTLSILLAIYDEEDAQLISTDMPYPGLNNDKYVGCVLPEDLKLKWKLIRDADSFALPKALEALKEIDLCHYDSDKSYDGRMWGYSKLWQSLKKGGILISDDVENNLAFKDFSNLVNKEPIIVKMRNENKSYKFQYNGVLVK